MKNSNLTLKSTVLLKAFDIELKKILEKDLANYRNKKFLQELLKQAA
jgi:hypothetical protein